MICVAAYKGSGVGAVFQEAVRPYSLGALTNSRFTASFLFPEWSGLLGLLLLKYHILSMNSATGV